jgi:hypothetical protein
MIGGIDWAYDLSQVGNPSYALSGSNLVYDTHPYSPYPEKASSTWDASFGNVSLTSPGEKL